MLYRIYPYQKAKYFLYFFSLIAGWPCVFFLMGWLPHYTFNYLFLLCVVLLFVVVKNNYQLPKPIASLLVLQVAVWGVYAGIHGLDTSYFTRILMLCITYLFLEIQLSYDRLGFIKTYNFWLAFQAIAGSIGFILVLMGILHPIFEFQELDMRPGYFFGLFTTNTYLTGFIRNAGFFDEPGALAFWGMYALIINKLFINNRKIEIILIFGLISTLSLAYFIQIFFYVWFFYKENRKKAIVYILVFVMILKLIGAFNEEMNNAIWGRMMYDSETGTLSGDNRSEMTKICWGIFKTSPLVGQGASHLIEIARQRSVFVGANPFLTMASDGLIGQMVIWSPFFYLLLLKKYDPKYGWVFWILIAGFLQRPYDCNQLLYPLMSFTIVLQAYLLKKKI